MDGILNVLKPPGMTSHDVISFLRREFKQKKIGHAGTLDPQAAGVLPICLGKATRLIDFLSIKEKEYLCKLELGSATETQDAWGIITSRDEIYQKNPGTISLERIQEVMASFQGEIEQNPPMYSAVKVQGEPLYKKARRGEIIETKARKVYIHSLNLLSYTPPEVTFVVRCSKGTYVRTLCHDIGKKLGVGGHLRFLLRSRVGKFSFMESHTLEDISQLKEKTLLPLDLAIEDMEKVVLSERQISSIFHGQAVLVKDYYSNHDTVAVLDNSGNFKAIAVMQLHEGGFLLKPKKVF